MKKYYSYKQICALLLLLMFITSCNGQTKTGLYKDSPDSIQVESKTISDGPPKIYGTAPEPFLHGQVSQYIRRMFQDKTGNIWFGTNGDGVCRYDGQSLTYFTTKEGFGGIAVRGILEDESGNIWFATDGGVSRYEGSRANHPCDKNSCKHDLQIPHDQKEHNLELAKSFTNYTKEDGLVNNQVWSIFKDIIGNLWFGTEGGVSRYDGIFFNSFPIPAADIKDFPNAYPAPKLVNCIFGDKTGNIWFGTNGGGVYRYDGGALTNFSEKNGLCNNFVQCIIEDKYGNLWFGTRFGGVSRYDGKTLPDGKASFINFSEKEGLSNNFIWTIYEDKIGTLWFGTAGGGLYRYDRKTLPDGQASFINFSEKEGLSNKFIQSILEDRNGTLWVGASGGLFRYDDKSLPVRHAGFINVTKEGPWQ